MKLYIKEKLLSLHNIFHIYDEEDKEVYMMSSKVISIGDKTTLLDMDKNELAYIEEEVLHLMPHYNIYVNGEIVCSIKKKFKLFKQDYELSNGYKVDGSFLGYNFNITDTNGEIVASIKRQVFSIGDKYEMEILDESNIIMLLSILVCICNDINRAQASSSSN